jgi:hypothetical protein
MVKPDKAIRPFVVTFLAIPHSKNKNEWDLFLTLCLISSSTVPDNTAFHITNILPKEPTMVCKRLYSITMHHY